jgi:ParB/RepB/Spo0J family partition protein
VSDTVARRYDFRLLPIELIDPPDVAMREQMDPDKLAELAEDIRANGMIQPGGVIVTGDRFRIIFGHRRFIGSQIAGERVYPAFVYPEGADVEEDLKIAENTIREDVNPAEEATYLATLLDKKCAGDMEKLCRLVKRKESWINGRLDLLRGDETVFDALRAGAIVLAVARELNKIRDPKFRALYLEDAIKQGASASTVSGWRMNAERFAKLQQAGNAPAAAEHQASEEGAIANVDVCLLCRLTSDSHLMEYVRVHRDCHAQHRRFQESERQS